MDTSSRQFGLLVAYLLPGFIALAGIARLVPAVARWLQPTTDQGSVGLGPPVYAVLAATALGMVLSCFRWLLIDHVHEWTGVRAPRWDVDRLEARLDAFNALVEYHYRYYQFYANTLIAVIWTYLLYRLSRASSLGFASDIGALMLCAALFAGSRDALTKYFARTDQLIGHVIETESEDDMTNGCHHDQNGASASKKAAETKAKPMRARATPKASAPKGKAASSVG